MKSHIDGYEWMEAASTVNWKYWTKSHIDGHILDGRPLYGNPLENAACTITKGKRVAVARNRGDATLVGFTA